MNNTTIDPVAPVASPAPTITVAAHPFAVADGAGVAGALVMLRAPSERHTPETIMATARASLASCVADPETGDAGVFLASLPERVTPVAALGLAVRAEGACEPDHAWHHVGTKDGASRWTYCAARVDRSQVSIVGRDSSAECDPAGGLTVDPGVPPHVEDALRSAYTAARGLVDPSRVLALVTAYLVRHGGRRITSDVYLMPSITPTTGGVLLGLVTLGGWAETVAVADAEKIARLTSPVTQSIEEQIAAVEAATADFIARAAKAAKGEGRLRARSIDTIRADIEAARRAATVWRDRLSLISLDVDDQLAALDAAAEAADRDAQARQEADRAARAAARAAARKANSIGGAA